MVAYLNVSKHPRLSIKKSFAQKFIGFGPDFINRRGPILNVRTLGFEQFA
jgi:hypothetical protein